MSLANRANPPLSVQGGKKRAPLWFFAIFVLVGAGGFYALFIRPALKVLEARHWVETPCTIVSSAVGDHSGEKGTTYSVDIVFHYAVGGRRFSSSRYGFMGGSSSGYAGKEAIVQRYPRGRHAVCYVNPANPAEAVLERSFTNDMFFGLIPLLFLIVGVVGLVATRKSRPVPAAEAWEPQAMRQAGNFGAVSAGPLEMTPAATPAGKFRNTILFALFWNGATAGFFYAFMGGWHIRHGEVGLLVFFGVFGLVGLVLVVATVQAFMGLFNPRVHLRLTPATLKPGQDFQLQWDIPGGSARLARLRIVLECQEKASRPGPPDSEGHRQDITEMDVCYRAELLNTAERTELAGGTANGAMPKGVMHSLNTGRNQIAWTIRVEGKMPRWPGIRDEYPVVMLPERWKENA